MPPLLRLQPLCSLACALAVALLAQEDPASAQEDAATAREDAATAYEEPKTARHARTLREDGWSFFVGPYIWLAGVNGTSYIDGQATDIDIGFDELFANTISGFLVYGEARYNKWFIGFDGTWAKLGNRLDDEDPGLELQLRQRLYDIRVGYEVRNRTLGSGRPSPEGFVRTTVGDVFIGARYYSTDLSLRLQLPPLPPASTGGVDTRIDPFVGLRWGYDFTHRWLITFRGDIGGFGVGDAARFSWQAAGTLGFKVKKRITFTFGYRALASDTVTSEGDNRNGADLLQHGPMVGAGFTF